MAGYIERILVTRQQLAQRVADLGARITQDFSPPNAPADGKIVVVPIMTGAMVFCADLIRHMPLQLRIGTLRVSSYPGRATQSHGAKIFEQNLGELRGRQVLVVDDILDSGTTLTAVVPHLRQLGAASVRTCVLLRKDRPEAMARPVDYVGFDIPDEFVVGYGLDYDDYYRNLPDVVSLKMESIRRYNHQQQ